MLSGTYISQMHTLTGISRGCLSFAKKKSFLTMTAFKGAVIIGAVYKFIVLRWFYPVVVPFRAWSPAPPSRRSSNAVCLVVKDDLYLCHTCVPLIIGSIVNVFLFRWNMPVFVKRVLRGGQTYVFEVLL